MKLSARRIAAFRREVWTHYEKHRRELPWRPPCEASAKQGTSNPWKILVSEVMLQQTQVARVMRYYGKFVKKFPTPRALAGARLAEVLAAWSGLGYNRRALALKRAAEIIVREHGAEVPRSVEKLRALPGIGKASAAAILAYAWDEPVVFVETNIRTVFLHHFFPRKRQVRDAEILKVVARTLPKKVEPFSRSKVQPCSVRAWYSALMDYGTHLKEQFGNLNTRSAHYARQSSFAGSRREARGEILRRALKGGVRAGEFPRDILDELVRDGFLKKRGKVFIIS